MKRIDEINSRGWANGWHAQELENNAKAQGKTMAELFAVQIANSSAWNVPAKAVKVTSAYVYYEFADGSTSKFANQKHGK
jgi:hypothetical protein